jgi:hypothetical protein
MTRPPNILVTGTPGTGMVTILLNELHTKLSHNSRGYVRPSRFELVSTSSRLPAALPQKGVCVLLWNL